MLSLWVKNTSLWTDFIAAMNLICVSHKVILCSNHVTGNQRKEESTGSKSNLYTSYLYSIKSNCLITNSYWALLICKYHAKSSIFCDRPNNPLNSVMLTFQYSTCGTWGPESTIKSTELVFQSVLVRSPSLPSNSPSSTTFCSVYWRFTVHLELPVSRCPWQDQLNLEVVITVSRDAHCMSPYC